MNGPREAAATPPKPAQLRPLVAEPGTTMGERLASLHRQIVGVVPEVDQIACVLYDADTDLLKTYVDSSMTGDPLQGYEFPLSASRSLSELAATRTTRVLDDIPTQATSGSVHSARIVKAGFRSSYTVPLFDGDLLQGFLFMDSRQPAVFTESVIDRLGVYVSLVRMVICHELTALRALVGSVRIAREFARLHDADAAGHLERMARYARLIARQLASRHGRNDEFVEQVYLFAPLHDIGKLGIPDGILHKPRSLTAQEQAVMATHVELGMKIIEKLIRHFRLEHLAGIQVLRNIVGGHHELLDGSGYPEGLRGAAIPLEARIVTVADIFDALSSQRDYKRAWSTTAALQHLEAMAGAGKVDPECVAALAESEEAVGEIMRHYRC
jgi:HD-GYP domain-containing protein (c-di-GMP phosphodiesterase class II)